MPVLPPTAASTMPSSVVGTCTTRTPRSQVAATNPARSVIAPPPSPTTASRAGEADLRRARPSRARPPRAVLASSASGTSSGVRVEPGARAASSRDRLGGRAQRRRVHQRRPARPRPSSGRPARRAARAPIDARRTARRRRRPVIRVAALTAGRALPSSRRRRPAPRAITAATCVRRSGRRCSTTSVRHLAGRAGAARRSSAAQRARAGCPASSGRSRPARPGRPRRRCRRRRNTTGAPGQRARGSLGQDRAAAEGEHAVVLGQRRGDRRPLQRAGRPARRRRRRSPRSACRRSASTSASVSRNGDRRAARPARRPTVVLPDAGRPDQHDHAGGVGAAPSRPDRRVAPADRLIAAARIGHGSPTASR